ncbi:hypothetical protein [Psychrobacter sp.]|uniref:hypothetical protein n=1 Tax=Psychrobacter sp. TaxID=56811 RepID=UPI002648277C|nr:hypothetical protein [Psychrobacter sp.]MDN6275690.1 hypothetical protein [Psychrobacter sp.]MDN6308942.1 hypothetical protein [Psychrobacter sp.]
MSYSSHPLSPKLFQLTALTLALALAGCGGGDGDTVDSIAPEFGTGSGAGDGGTDGDDTNVSTSNVDEIYISSGKSQLSTGGDNTTVEIRVIDENGGIIAGVPVTVSVSDAALYGLSIDGSSIQTTDENGLISLSLQQSSVGIDSRLNHESIMTVTANDGSGVTQSLPIIVSGTRADNVIASKNTITDTENFSISGRVLDAQGEVFANTTVVLFNDSNEIATRTTDINGEFIFDTNAALLTAVDGRYSFSLDIQGSQITQRISNLVTVAAVGDDSSDIMFAPISDIEVNESEEMTLNFPDGYNGDTVVISTNKGKILDNDGQASSRRTFEVSNNQVVFYVESGVPGNANITAEYDNDATATTINFVSTAPTQLLLQIERAVISTGGSTQVIARVLDVDDAPVKNAIVQFTTTKDASGGSLGQAVAYTDNNGQAIVTYNAGQNSTSTDGVVIEAEVQALKLPDGTEKSVSVPLDDSGITVQTKSTFISFAFANTVRSGDRDVYYYRNGSISVLDNTGQPAINQQVSVNLIPEEYYKGFYSIGIDLSGDDAWVKSALACDNEDVNNNGILNLGEDTNGNGQLDPVNVAAVLDGDGNEVSLNPSQGFNLTTDDFGKIDFSVRYPKEYAEWYLSSITVNTRVDGSESQQSRLIDFPVLVDDVDISDGIRPNLNSPFGIATNSCDNPD